MAGRYPQEWLDALRQRADIVALIGSYVQLKKNGHRYVGLCPFHNERTPSFFVDGQKQLYYCFGCKASGSAIQFVMDIERLSFPEAVEFLANQLHMPLPEMQNDPAYEKRRSLKERIFLANKAAARLYHQHLWEEDGAESLTYLKKRGLSDAVIRRFGLGAAAARPNVGSTLMTEGFTREELLSAGLILERNGRTFDMFRNRAVFPIIDAYGNVLGFGGRALGDVQPKYLNTSDTPAFNKRYNVFAANLLRKARGLSRVILVEGYMDVVALNQFGVEGVAATLGTALTPEQAKLLARYAPEVWLSYDGDSAGQKAILRGLDVLEEAGVPAKVLDLPGGLDPDEYIRQEGPEAFAALKPVSGTTYRMLREKERHDMATEEGRTEYAKACAVFLRRVREPVELDNYLKRLSLESGFDREVLQEQVGLRPAVGSSPAPKRREFRAKAREAAGIDWTSRTLLAVVATGRLPAGSVTPEEFDDPECRALCRALLEGTSPAALLEQQPDDQSRALLGDVFSVDVNVDDEGLMRMAQDCLKKLRRNREPDKPPESRAVDPEKKQQEEIYQAYLLAQKWKELK